MFSLLLVFGLGIAQAVHWHGASLSTGTQRVCGPAAADHSLDEANCPLCTIMHAVLPVAARAVWAPNHAEGKEALARPLHLAGILRFSLYGRPPPPLS